MKKYLLALLVWLFTISWSHAQLEIKGKVINAETQEPMPKVSVVSENTGGGTTTDYDGIFRFVVSNKSDVTLTFSHIGFETQQRSFKPSDTNNIHLISMISSSQELNEIEIMGVNLENRPYRTEDVKIGMLESSNLQDAGDLLREMPNISGVRKGAVGIDPVVRGFKYSQLNVQLNGGTRIEGGCPNRMDPATAHVDLNDLKQIKVLKGPFALKYGVNFAGIIDMTTYEPEFKEKYKTNVDVALGGQTNHSGFKSKVGISGANNIFTYSLSGSWKKYNDYKDGNENWVPASLEQQAYTANLGFRIANKHIIYGSAELSKGVNVDFPTLSMDEREDDTKVYSINYIANDIGKSINFIRVKAYLSDVNHEMDNKNRPFSDTVVAISNIHARNTGGKAGVNFNIGKAKMEVGGDYENIRKDGTRTKYLIMQPMLPRKDEDLWNNAKVNNLGIFAEYHSTGKKIDWVVAARLDFNSANSGPLLRTNMAGDAIYINDSTDSQHTNLSFSGGFTWHISNSSDVLVSLGRGSRSPDITERFIILLPIGYDPYDYLGNPQLKPEVNNELDLGYRFRNSKAGNFEVSGFFSYVQNYIIGELLPPSEIKPQTPGVLGVKRFTNIDQAYMTGFEFTYNTPSRYLWEIIFNASYTTGWNPEAIAYEYEDGKVVDEIMVDNDPLPEIPPFEIFLAANYKFFKGKFVPAVSVRSVASQNRVSMAYNEQTTPGFVLLNLDLKYQFNKYLKVYAGVKNLLNTSYYEHLNRNIVGTSYPLYEPGRVFYANLIFNF